MEAATDRVERTQTLPFPPFLALLFFLPRIGVKGWGKAEATALSLSSFLLSSGVPSPLRHRDETGV